MPVTKFVWTIRLSDQVVSEFDGPFENEANEGDLSPADVARISSLAVGDSTTFIDDGDEMFTITRNR